MMARVRDVAFESGLARTALNFSRPRAWAPPAIAAVLRRRAAPRDRAVHLAETMAWLARAQDAVDGGVSAAYSLRAGWYPAYPETTGYIICTFYDYAARSGDKAYHDRAGRLADWVLGLQNSDGGFPGGFLRSRNQPPVVFDVGQMLQGLVRAHDETRDGRYLNAARRAGDWLVGVQDGDGAWRRHEYHGIPHAYETRTAWALASLALATGDEAYAAAAWQNARWTMARQRASGWFEDAAFRRGDMPLTHTIAYTIEGLTELGMELREASAVEAARRAADALLRRYEERSRWDRAPAGLVPGRLDEDWRSPDRWACLTGCAQIALAWLRFAEIDGDPGRYVPAASRLLGAVLTAHDTLTLTPEVRGALAGPYPLWGAYQSYAYPNWAAKFLADALLHEADLNP